MTRLSTLLDEIDSGVVLLPEFQQYAPTKMAGDPKWVNVTELFGKGPTRYLSLDPPIE